MFIDCIFKIVFVLPKPVIGSFFSLHNLPIKETKESLINEQIKDK